MLAHSVIAPSFGPMDPLATLKMLLGDGDRAKLTVMVNWLTEIRRRAVPAR